MEIGADVGDAVEFSGNDDGNNSYHIIAFAYGFYIDHRGDAIAAHLPHWRIVKKAEPAKTIRDEFAIAAAISMIENGSMDETIICKVAYRFADDMMEARKK